MSRDIWQYFLVEVGRRNVHRGRYALEFGGRTINTGRYLLFDTVRCFFVLITGLLVEQV